MKKHQREYKNTERKQGKKHVMMYSSVITVVLICHLSQRFIIVSSTTLLRHVWRLPLNAAPNKACSALSVSAAILFFHK